MKIAYLHGLESSINQKDPKIIFLNENFDEVFTPSINYKDKNTFNNLFNSIKKMNPDVIVGSSMGGYVSYLIGSKLGIETILFNPAVSGRSFDPIVDDTKLKGTSNNVFLGKSDDVILGSDVKSFFREKGIGGFKYQQYVGGHRVPAEVFIEAIRKVVNITEIYNNDKKELVDMKHIQLFEQFVGEKADYKSKKSNKYSVKATVCYLDSIRGKRTCKEIYFKSRFDAEGFSDKVVGFPKGAEVESITEESNNSN